MNDPARQVSHEDSSQIAPTVISFPSGNTYERPGSGGIAWHSSTDQMFEDYLKKLIDDAVLNAHFKLQLSRVRATNNPFGSVYLAQLETDPISAIDVNHLLSCSGIEDLSSTISFDDEWDD